MIKYDREVIFMVKVGIDRINETEIKALLSGKRLGVISACSALSLIHI